MSVRKAAIQAWFECHYCTGNRGTVGENPVAVARKTLLGEINAFLANMGWSAWKTQSALYKELVSARRYGADRAATGPFIIATASHPVATWATREPSSSAWTRWQCTCASTWAWDDGVERAGLINKKTWKTRPMEGLSG